jgi:hypothetical protein
VPPPAPGPQDNNPPAVVTALSGPVYRVQLGWLGACPLDSWERVNLFVPDDGSLPCSYSGHAAASVLRALGINGAGQSLAR